MVTVEILYVEGCPNVDKARDQVREAIRREHLDGVDVAETLVRDQAHAQELSFPGTPTIRVNGRDVAEDQVGTHMRTYDFNGILMGHPGWRDIANAVREIQRSSLQR